MPGDWSGNGAPVKFSTRETREEGKGWFVIQEHLRRLQQVRAQLNELTQVMAKCAGDWLRSTVNLKGSMELQCLS